MLGRVSRPVAEVLLRGEEDVWVRLLMFVDSAADFTLIPLKLGEALGLKYRTSEIRHARGVGRKSIPVVIKKLQMRLAGKSIYARIAWSLIEDVPMVLGRKDVFELFTVSFDEAKKQVTFE